VCLASFIIHGPAIRSRGALVDGQIPESLTPQECGHNLAHVANFRRLGDYEDGRSDSEYS
jgi:hypothetical protein